MNVLELVEELSPWWRSPEKRPSSAFPYRRKLYDEVLQKIDGRTGAVLLVGPQRVGKTVLLRQIADAVRFEPLPGSGGTVFPHGNVTYVDLADARLESDPDLFSLLDAKPSGHDPSAPRLLLIDEIVQLERWWAVLRTLVDRTREGLGGLAGTRIVATGSSARALDVESLEARIGRFELIEIEPLDFSEYLALRSASDLDPAEVLAQRPDELERYLSIGGFPEAALRTHPDPTHELARECVRKMAQDTINKEVLRAGLDSRVFDLFQRLARRSGDAVRVKNLAGDLECSENSIRDWLSFLRSTRMLHELKPFWTSSKAYKPRLQHSKVYATDHGLISAFESVQRLSDEEVRGRVFEAVVFRHLRDLARSGRSGLGFIRSPEEVDFVLRRPDDPIGIEVTASRNPARKTKRLRDVKEEARLASVFVVHGGHQSSESNSIFHLPIHRFLLRPSIVLEGGAGS